MDGRYKKEGLARARKQKEEWTTEGNHEAVDRNYL